MRPNDGVQHRPAAYNLEIRDHLYKLFKKMGRKERLKLELINKKVKKILEDPHLYKPLKAPMQHMYRVHIGGSFVLIFSINKKAKSVALEDFVHHYEAYR